MTKTWHSVAISQVRGVIELPSSWFVGRFEACGGFVVRVLCVFAGSQEARTEQFDNTPNLRYGN